MLREGLPCYFARQLQLPLHSSCRGESVWFERVGLGMRSGQHVAALGMQSAAVLPCLGCRTSPVGCRTGACALLRLQRCTSLPGSARVYSGVWQSRRVCCRQVRGQGAMCCSARSGAEPPRLAGKNSRVGVAPGPAQENAPSWLWDSLDDFNECFFPFLTKPEEEVPRAPCRALLCCPPHPHS